MNNTYVTLTPKMSHQNSCIFVYFCHKCTNKTYIFVWTTQIWLLQHVCNNEILFHKVLSFLIIEKNNLKVMRVGKKNTVPVLELCTYIILTFQNEGNLSLEKAGELDLIRKSLAVCFLNSLHAKFLIYKRLSIQN